MHIRGLLIDKDDTLIKIEPFWKEPIHQLALMTADDMGKQNDTELIKEFEKAAGFIDGYLIPESIIVAGTNEDIFDKWKQIADEKNIKTVIFDSLKYKQLWLGRLSDLCFKYGKVEPYEELIEYFSSLNDKGIMVGVVTSDSWEMTVHCLRMLGIDKYINDIYTADKYKPKPNPEVAMLFADKHSLLLQNVLMVGDSNNDMLFAHNSGIHGIQIDYRHGVELSEYAEGSIHSLADLFAFI